MYVDLILKEAADLFKIFTVKVLYCHFLDFSFQLFYTNLEFETSTQNNYDRRSTK